MRRPYIETGFLNAAACARIRAAMDLGVEEAAEILRGGATVSERVRNASYRDVDGDTLAFVESCLDSRRDRIGRWFSIPLTAREGAGFVRYGAGGFYRAHRDRCVDPSWSGAARRQVAVVVFLNESRDCPAPGEFSGGTLRLLDVDTSRRHLDVIPARGSLVAFPARTVHEVAHVLAGTRDVVVDWFY